LDLRERNEEKTILHQRKENGMGDGETVFYLQKTKIFKHTIFLEIVFIYLGRCPSSWFFKYVSETRSLSVIGRKEVKFLSQLTPLERPNFDYRTRSTF
jgi:hypothetical protein